MKKIKNKQRKPIFLPAFLLLFSAWVYWGNTSIQTTYFDIGSEKIPWAFDGFTLLQVSDLHNAEFGSHQHILLNAVKNASPDIIVVTGDLIDSAHTDVAKAMDFISGAVAIAPVYYVTGNHEACSDQYAELKRQMAEAGVGILEDQKVALQRNGASIQLLGLNDPNFSTPEGASTLSSRLKHILGESNQYTILLSHRPELFDAYVASNIHLVLSGHTHGGQIRLPLIGGLAAPNQGFFPKYSEGLHERDQTKMIVSRGLGNSIIPVRIHNRPELVVLTLISQRVSS